ncbi:hypothetical protein WMF38_21055 [Sorangium sp. So ce118]
MPRWLMRIDRAFSSADLVAIDARTGPESDASDRRTAVVTLALH